MRFITKIAVAIVGCRALLSFNNEAPELNYSPTNVSDQGQLNIRNLVLQDDRNPKNILDLQQGDCIKFLFYPIRSYQVQAEASQVSYDSLYSFIPQDKLDCQEIKPAVTCQRISDVEFTITLNSNEKNLRGIIKGFQNPFSVNTLTIQSIGYYRQCNLVNTPIHTLRAGFYPKIVMEPQISVSASIKTEMTGTVNGVETKTQIIGEKGQKNIAIFQVKLKTALRPEGGRIIITSTKRITSITDKTYPFDQTDGSSCVSDSFQSAITFYKQGEIDSEGYLQITYTRLKDKADLKSLTLTCRNWQNPNTPDLQSGYQIKIYDFNLTTLIEITNKFDLDANNYLPFQIPKDKDIQILLSKNKVQASNELTISFQPPVTLELKTNEPGCYIKYTIPNEIILPKSYDLTFLGKKMLTLYNQTQLFDDDALNSLETITPLDHNLDDDTMPNWIIFPACITDGTYNRKNQMADQEMFITLNPVINPYAVRTTSNFTIEIYANYTNKQLSRKIISSTQQNIAQRDLDTNYIQYISMTTDNYIVQETGKYTLQFSTSSIIPGIKSGQMSYPVSGGIHIFWPLAINSQPVLDPKSIQLQAGNAVVTILNIIRDQSNIYNPDCQLSTCYLISFSSDIDINPQTLTLILDKQIKNPDSINDAGYFTISTLMQYKDLDALIFYKIDTVVNTPSNFNAKPGLILRDTIIINSITADAATAANNQIFSFTFTPTHYIPSGGFIRFYIPNAFSISSAASAVALFKIQQVGMVPAKNFALVDNIDATKNLVQGRSTEKMEQGKPYEVTLAGIRNARYTIINDELPEEEKQYFKVQTFDSDNDTVSKNLIDEGEGGTYDITKLSQMSGFSVEPYNTTNGAVTEYFITWQTDIETRTGDNLFVQFPEEIQFKNNASLPDGRLYCESKTNSLISTECSFKDQTLQINLKQVQDQYGLYKVAVSSIQNAPSLKQTGQFGKVYHTTQNPNQKIEEFNKPVYVANDFTSLLQGLSGDSIVQTTEEYEKYADFVITFTPSSILKTSRPTIQLSYPDTVLPQQGASCTVVANDVFSDPKDCTLNEGARMFTIQNAYPENYAGPVQIKLTLRNPIDNWGTVGFKIRSSEKATVSVVDPTTKETIQATKNYLIDVIELDSLIPNLKCIAPCKECEELDGKILQKTYCARCWQNKPMKFLQVRTPWIPDLTGNATCQSQCDAGFTTDGDKDEHICVKCDESCATCVDNEEKGDKMKCKTCSKKYPFLYSPDEKCLESCYRGFYQVNDKTCDKCDQTCQGCSGDKFNCTSCDPKVEKKVLQVDIRNQGGKTFARGSCLSTCPAGFFFQSLNETFNICQPCQQPCATCNATADTCLSCTGQNNKTYSYQFKCYSQCPNQTAPDMSTQVCVPCPPNCNKCGTSGENNCYECQAPFLLEDGFCVESCTKSGYYANKAKTQCINKTEFPNIGPVFSIISLVIVIVVLMVKKLKKDTEVIPSIIAIVGVVETFSTLFQIWMCSIYNQPRYLAFTIFAIVVQYILNVYNYWYIDTNVIADTATKKEKISKSQFDKMVQEQLAKNHRAKKRDKMYEKMKDKQNPTKYQSINDMEPEDIEAPLIDQEFAENNDEFNEKDAFEGGLSMIEMVRLKRGLQGSNRYNNKSARRQEPSDDEIDMEGGKVLDTSSAKTKEDRKEEGGNFFNCFAKKKQAQISYEDKDEKEIARRQVIARENIKANDEGTGYYQEKNITDKGFQKWMKTYDKTASVIKWVSLLISFKFYRMTYSFFMGRKQFIVLYQKKKFKKHIQATTLASQFFVKVPLIIADVVAITQVPLGTQLILTVIDTLILSIFLVIMEFYEIARIDTIMRTYNVSGYKDRKSLAACESSEDSDYLSSDPSSEEDDYQDWRLNLKNVEGNNNLFKKTPVQLQINDLEKEFDKRLALSCHEFKTGTEIEEDPREVKSFPPSPKYYEDFELPDFGGYVNYGKLFDNVYADSKDPGKKDAGKEFSEMGTQAAPSDIYAALQRKGINQLNIGVEDKQGQKDASNLYKKKGQKKKRGRKNKYYRQIDAEDDEEADQMSDGSDEDGLDGIKEEDEEDEDEKKAKMAKQKAREKEEERIGIEEEDRLKKLAEKQQNLIDEENRKIQAELDRKEAEERERKNTINSNIDKTINQSDNTSELSGIMVKSNAFQSFQDQQLLNQVIQVPPTFESRRFNENDILGNLDRDEKGNVLTLMNQENVDQYVDKDGKPTNPRGYLVDPKTGDVINNLNGQPMFKGKDLDEKGELPAPFNIEKHNFNPHLVRGDFDFDRNGKPLIKKDPTGKLVDKKGSSVSSRGYRVDKDGNILDNYGRKKFNPGHVTNDGDLPKMFNYNGRRFDITDVIGQVDKDALGNIIPLTDQDGNLIDNLGRMINSRGYLVDEQGNVIDKEGRQIFERKHLKNDEIPKIFPFTKFNIKNVLGDFEMDPLGNPILDKDKKGNLIDRQGKRVNAKGYLVDDKGNVINKNGKVVFEFPILDQEGDIPKVFRTGLLKSDTASSLSRLMSEIGNHQPSDFDAEEQRIQDEIRRDLNRRKRGHSGNTSVDSMMEDTPANYNQQNQRFDVQRNQAAPPELEEEDDEEDEYGSQFDQFMNQTEGFGRQGPANEAYELAKKKKKKKSKKKKKKKIEMEDPSLREHLLAGAYGGVAKPKPKRQGVKYTTDIDAGLRDIASPAVFMRDHSQKKMISSISGFAGIGLNAPESQRGRRVEAKNSNRLRSSVGRSEVGSNFGSKIGGLRKVNESTSKLLDPQQREDQLKQQQMDEIMRKKQARLAQKKKKAAMAGKFTKDADFEKMFGQDIDEFLEDSEWDIESMDKMSQFSKGSKQTIHSAAQAGKLRGLEKLYLQRLETSQLKAGMAATGQVGVTQAQATQKKKQFRGTGEASKQAWETNSRASKAPQR